MYIISTVQIVICYHWKKVSVHSIGDFFFHETTIFANSGWHITMQCIDLQTCFKQNFLDRHHAWRSLDPTLDIYLPFMRSILPPFFKKTHTIHKINVCLRQKSPENWSYLPNPVFHASYKYGLHFEIDPAFLVLFQFF